MLFSSGVKWTMKIAKWTQVEEAALSSLSLVSFRPQSLFYLCLISFIAPSPTWGVRQWPQYWELKKWPLAWGHWTCCAGATVILLCHFSGSQKNAEERRACIISRGLFLWKGNLRLSIALAWVFSPTFSLFFLENTPFLYLASLTYCALRILRIKITNSPYCIFPITSLLHLGSVSL